MNNLAGYFQKFRNIIPRDRLVRSACAETIAEVVGVSLDPRVCKLQQGIIWIQAAGVIRQEIDRKRDVIVQTLRNRLPNITIHTIRFQ